MKNVPLGSQSLLLQAFKPSIYLQSYTEDSGESFILDKCFYLAHHYGTNSKHQDIGVGTEKASTPYPLRLLSM